VTLTSDLESYFSIFRRMYFRHYWSAIDVPCYEYFLWWTLKKRKKKRRRRRRRKKRSRRRFSH